MSTPSKECTKCKTVFPVSDFYKSRKTKDGLTYECNRCQKLRSTEHYEANKTTRLEANRKWQSSNRSKVKQINRRAHLKQYGLTEEAYASMLSEQHGRCAVCRQEESVKEVLSVDHCHTTGTVRGLLCSRCNTGLGLFSDNPDILRKAVEYLEVISESTASTSLSNHRE